MVTNGSKAGGSAAPPHELNVWKFAESRAPELESLHAIVADRLDNNFRSQRNKRRRTTGHDNRVAKKFRKGVGLVVMGKTGPVKKDEKKVSRRVRRNTELKKNPPNGFVTSGDGTKRLRTHVWHAKRFKMEKLWGFYIPLGLHGRGRGSRALLKKLRHGVLVHDASYYVSFQLEGPQDILQSVLSCVLVPSPSASFEEASHDILSGKVFVTAMLHHAGKPCFAPISPVTYMWQPLQRISINVEGVTTDFPVGEQNTEDKSIIRKLWVWMHAAASDEAYDALSSACERNTDTTRSVHCVSREGQLAKLELIGSEVFQLLQKTLLPDSLNSGNFLLLKKCSADEHDDHGKCKKMSIFENGHQISSSAVVSLVVKDPRTLTKKRDANLGGKAHDLSIDEECQSKEQAVPKNEGEFVYEHSDLWDASKEVCPPVEESVLCMEKHQQRKEFFCLGDQSSMSQNASVDGKYSRSCPILLLKHGDIQDSLTRCSIILPLSWVKPFWITFIANGANAIGLREKHWVASEIGLPYFPFDFPDCNAYSHFMAMESVTVNHKASLVPPSKRPLRVPIPPPWDCVHLNIVKILSKDEDSRIQDGKFEITDYENSHNGNSVCHFTPFEGTIARTSCMLRDILSNYTCNNLLLFPQIPGQKYCLHKFMREREFLEQDTLLSEMKSGETPCYLRVLLRAFKEGVFEQGAVVCAPHIADIALWTARSGDDDRRLQIPKSLLRSYFVQLPSGKWELQVPEEQALRESHRWPIGFVTTGFVRGSKKAMAGAVCEARLLSWLREEQWKAVPAKRRKKEIYVLVRNMRSTAYRLALATIVLEKHEEAVDFI